MGVTAWLCSRSASLDDLVLFEGVWVVGHKRPPCVYISSGSAKPTEFNPARLHPPISAFATNTHFSASVDFQGRNDPPPKGYVENSSAVFFQNTSTLDCAGMSCSVMPRFSLLRASSFSIRSSNPCTRLPVTVCL